jgi:hypothetical protein
MTHLEYLYERVKLGIDAHPSEKEIEDFLWYAKLISPHRTFVVKGCQDCVNELVRFVFENVNRLNNGNK